MVGVENVHNGENTPRLIGGFLKGRRFHPCVGQVCSSPPRFFYRTEKTTVFLDNASNLLFLGEKGANDDYGTSRWI
jgi:hypothetical protein